MLWQRGQAVIPRGKAAREMRPRENPGSAACLNPYRKSRASPSSGWARWALAWRPRCGAPVSRSPAAMFRRTRSRGSSPTAARAPRRRREAAEGRRHRRQRGRQRRADRNHPVRQGRRRRNPGQGRGVHLLRDHGPGRGAAAGQTAGGDRPALSRRADLRRRAARGAGRTHHSGVGQSPRPSPRRGRRSMRWRQNSTNSAMPRGRAPRSR